jgi:hypothetical protein
MQDDSLSPFVTDELPRYAKQYDEARANQQNQYCEKDRP